MRLALLSTVAALLGLGLAVPVAPADPDIAVVLKSLSRRCVALLAPASKLGIFYGPYRLLDPGPWTTIITGLSDIATTMTSGTSAVPPTGQYTASDEMAITNAFHSYSTAQAGLLDSIAQAGGVVLTVPVLAPMVEQPMNEVLTSVSDMVRTVVRRLGDDGAGSIQTDMVPLSQAFEAALGAFS